MSKESEESLRKFNDWKLDLEWRCEQHMITHREKSPQPLTKSFVTPTSKVIVTESVSIRGQWQVWINGVLEFVASGALGRMKAQKFADDRWEKMGFTGNDTAPTYSLPPVCVFCGARYLHRRGCPDEKTEGPKLLPSGDPPQPA